MSGHSLRSGSAQTLAADGASIAELQQAGGWKSPSTPGIYVRNEAASARAGRQAPLQGGRVNLDALAPVIGDRRRVGRLERLLGRRLQEEIPVAAVLPVCLGRCSGSR